MSRTNKKNQDDADRTLRYGLNRWQDATRKVRGQMRPVKILAYRDKKGRIRYKMRVVDPKIGDGAHRKVTREEARAFQDERSQRAKTMDAKATSKVVDDARFLAHPGRFDFKNVDTKGRGAHGGEGYGANKVAPVSRTEREQINALLDQRVFTVPEVADRVGVSARQVQRVKAGRRSRKLRATQFQAEWEAAEREAPQKTRRSEYLFPLHRWVRTTRRVDGKMRPVYAMAYIKGGKRHYRIRLEAPPKFLTRKDLHEPSDEEFIVASLRHSEWTQVEAHTLPRERKSLSKFPLNRWVQTHRRVDGEVRPVYIMAYLRRGKRLYKQRLTPPDKYLTRKDLREPSLEEVAAEEFRRSEWDEAERDVQWEARKKHKTEPIPEPPRLSEEFRNVGIRTENIQHWDDMKRLDESHAAVMEDFERRLRSLKGAVTDKYQIPMDEGKRDQIRDYERTFHEVRLEFLHGQSAPAMKGEIDKLEKKRQRLYESFAWGEANRADRPEREARLGAWRAVEEPRVIRETKYPLNVWVRTTRRVDGEMRPVYVRATLDARGNRQYEQRLTPPEAFLTRRQVEELSAEAVATREARRREWTGASQERKPWSKYPLGIWIETRRMHEGKVRRAWVMRHLDKNRSTYTVRFVKPTDANETILTKRELEQTRRGAFNIIERLLKYDFAAEFRKKAIYEWTPGEAQAQLDKLKGVDWALMSGDFSKLIHNPTQAQILAEDYGNPNSKFWKDIFHQLETRKRFWTYIDEGTRNYLELVRCEDRQKTLTKKYEAEGNIDHKREIWAELKEVNQELRDAYASLSHTQYKVDGIVSQEYEGKEKPPAVSLRVPEGAPAEFVIPRPSKQQKVTLTKDDWEKYDNAALKTILARFEVEGRGKLKTRGELEAAARPFVEVFKRDRWEEEDWATIAPGYDYSSSDHIMMNDTRTIAVTRADQDDALRRVLDVQVDLGKKKLRELLAEAPVFDDDSLVLDVDSGTMYSKRMLAEAARLVGPEAHVEFQKAGPIAFLGSELSACVAPRVISDAEDSRLTDQFKAWREEYQEREKRYTSDTTGTREYLEALNPRELSQIAATYQIKNRGSLTREKLEREVYEYASKFDKPNWSATDFELMWGKPTVPDDSGLIFDEARIMATCNTPEVASRFADFPGLKKMNARDPASLSALVKSVDRQDPDVVIGNAKYSKHYLNEIRRLTGDDVKIAQSEEPDMPLMVEGRGRTVLLAPKVEDTRYDDIEIGDDGE